MSVKNIVTALPEACGVQKDLAGFFGEINGKLFDWERDNPEGLLHRRNFESVRDRLALAFDGWRNLTESTAKYYALDLLVYAARTIDAGGGDWLGKRTAREELLAQEDTPENAGVKALLTVETAGTMSNWA